MTTVMDVEEFRVLEVFPQTRQVPQYFAEFGEKLPQKLKNGVSMFLLHTPDGAATEAIAEVVPEAQPEAEAPSKKRKYKKKTDLCDTVPEVVETPKKVRAKKVDVHYKLYLKATQDGVLGKKNALIEAQKIPSGTIIHLIRGGKYIKTMIYYNRFWHDL